MKSIPRLGMTQSQKLAVIRGVVPNPLRWPTGCRFMPRCDYAFDKCVKQPPIFDLGGGQSSACWLCESGRRPVSPKPPDSGQAFAPKPADVGAGESTAEA
jgi:oligopeptide/dipeptide ABC transporter ATP-binding protein